MMFYLCKYLDKLVVDECLDWLQTANADLARCLAAVQWNLEVEVC